MQPSSVSCMGHKTKLMQHYSELDVAFTWSSNQNCRFFCTYLLRISINCGAILLKNVSLFLQKIYAFIGKIMAATKKNINFDEVINSF